MTALEAPLAPGFGTRATRFLWTCVSSPGNIALSLGLLLLLGYALPGLVDWVLLRAHWGTDPQSCAHVYGACWVFVQVRWDQFIYGSYPRSEWWRADIVFAVVIAGGVALLNRRVRRKGLIGALLIVAAPALAAMLLLGGVLGLKPVDAHEWGGLLLTVTLGGAALAGALPTGLLLALARRSELPAIRYLAVGWIEFLRGVPLIPLLFIAMNVFPLLLPPGSNPSAFEKIVVAFILFNGAALAEVFRGGLQAIPKGQFEAAKSLGFGPARTMALIILPQAVAIVTPGLVNVAVAIVKETTVIYIIGLFDFLTQIQAGLEAPNWLLGDQVRDSGYLFAALVYWGVCFGLSQVSKRLELQKERRG